MRGRSYWIFFVKLALLTTAIIASSACMAGAVTYNPAVEGANATHFVYGVGSGSTFSQYGAANALSGGTCQINTGAGTACFEATPLNYLGVYFVANDGVSNTAFVYSSDVTLHPGQFGELSTVAFVAPKAGSYTFNGFFRAVDAAAGNGVTFATPQSSGIIAPGGSTSFGFTQVLGAGQKAFFSIGNNGSYSYDTTGLQLNVGNVPEPAAWTMMIAGFGLIAGALRRRSRGAVAA